MKLKKATIKDFRSVVGIMDLFIDDKITTLVGANEHGKSNVIQALKFLDTSIPFEAGKDYRLDEASESHFPIIELCLTLSPQDSENINQQFKFTFDAIPAEERVGFVIPELPTEVILVRNGDPSGTPSAVKNFVDPYQAIILSYIDSLYKGKVIYFDDFNDRLASVITDPELQDPSNLIIKGLLKLSGLEEVRNRLFDESSQIRKLFKDAPSKLTNEVRKNWFQGNNDKLTINLNAYQNSKTIRIDIEDENTYVDFEARSRGFRWYLSFFLKYRAYSDGELKGCLFLLDEPGLFLHPRGQKDLMNFFEVLGAHNQMVYTTHSPFMISRINQQRVRVVEKMKGRGTLINAKGFISNWRPLRTSLGLALSDSFYFADNTLLVEGPEDRIYILALLRLYAKHRAKNIDLNMLSIMDAGGASELPAMARIINDEDRPLIVLIDSDSQKHQNKLKKFLDEKLVKEIKDFNANAVTIQDLLPKAQYELAVNNSLTALESSGHIERKKGKKGAFVTVNTSKVDKDVAEFVKENFNEDDISKVGIANEFEKIVLKDDFAYDANSFIDVFKLIDWLVEELKLEIKE